MFEVDFKLNALFRNDVCQYLQQNPCPTSFTSVPHLEGHCSLVPPTLTPGNSVWFVNWEMTSLHLDDHVQNGCAFSCPPLCLCCAGWWRFYRDPHDNHTSSLSSAIISNTSRMCPTQPELSGRMCVHVCVLFSVRVTVYEWANIYTLLRALLRLVSAVAEFMLLSPEHLFSNYTNIRMKNSWITRPEKLMYFILFSLYFYLICLCRRYKDQIYCAFYWMISNEYPLLTFFSLSSKWGLKSKCQTRWNQLLKGHHLQILLVLTLMWIAFLWVLEHLSDQTRDLIIGGWKL